MSVVLRVGAVHTDFGKDGGCADIDSYDDGSAPEDYSRPPSHYFPGCFGLPYQDHNYGAPPPATPPPKVSSPLGFVDKINGHIEVEEVSVTSRIVQQANVDITSDNVDDSVTRCICDFTHDDGYMICCDKCSVWQHIDCMAVDRSNIPDNYFCELCEPRPMDRERARQIQVRKREFILGADSSTDTDPEEPANRRRSQDMIKKCKTKRRTKTMKIKDEKGKRMTNYRKDIKKEKENKDTNKKLRISLKESFRKNMKNKQSKKPGLSSMEFNDNAQQDPWDSSNSPWVDKYEEAKENQYSSDMQAILGLKKLNGSLSSSGNYNYNRNGRILVQLCHVTEVNKNRKGLEASETIGEGEAIIEYTGHVMLREQFNKESFYKRLNPFVLFNSMFDNIELCIDATSYGNIARFIRRSCKSNAEVKHTFEDGELTFIVVATKVIPRGSEITIPYDYNYKECTYCVECACLRNNCPVAKYFKRKQNAQNRKEKVITKRSLRQGKSPSKNGRNSVKVVVNQHPKSPKSPASSLPHSPTKSPIRKSISVEESTIKEEVEEIEPEIPLPPPPSVVSPVKEERASEVKEEAPIDHNTDSGTDHHDTHSESEENPSSERTRRMSREDRKMEAIMKAFEKMEKRQERRKEALARIEGTKKPTSNKTAEDVKKEKGKSKVHQDPKESKKANECDNSAEEEKKEAAKVKSEKVELEIKDTSPPLVSPKKEVKVSHKKRKRTSSSSKRKTRAQSTNTVKSEPQSHDEGSNTVPSCPSTPVSAPPDVPNTPPSFKFLKTKKHLMNEWLSEKNQDVAPLPPPHPSKIEPLEVQVEEVMYVACKPSPRNALDHLRRNSTSSGSSPYSSLASLNKQCGENSIGSAKKRWLRQAMFDKPVPGTLSRPMSPLGPAGGSSPNPHVSLPSPGGSPPGDYITPLKKRRLASYRESLDQPYTGTSDIGSSAAEDEALDTNNSELVSSEGIQDHIDDQPEGDIHVKQERADASSSVVNTEENISSDPEHNIDHVVVSRAERVTCDTGSSCVTSHTDSVIQSSNECDSRQEIDSVEDIADTCDTNCHKTEVMEVDSTQSDSCREVDKKEALCDSTCKVEDNPACSSSQSITVAELSLVDSSSDVNMSEKSSEVVQVNADSIVGNMSGGNDSLLPENVCSSSDRNVLVSNFDVSSSSESNQSATHVESSQVTDSVNVSSTEQTCSLYSATSNLQESGVADSSMSDQKTDLSDVCVSDVSGTGDSVHYVNNISATESVGEPVASSSIAEDSGVSSEPSTPQEAHQPTKKKVSLLEYRKRLKDKTTVSTPSCSKSSGSAGVSAPSSTTSPIHRHHRFSTLPSLPLFDSSPTKDHSSRYQFKSSSDLIRRKSPDSVKEKRPQLSLSERLRMEFGLEDSEEEKDTEKGTEAVSTPATSSVQQTPVFQHPPVMLRGPTPGLVPNGPSPGPVPTVTNMNGGGAGPMGSSPVLSSKGPSSHLLINGAPQPQGLLPASGGKAIPSLLSIKTFPSRNLPNGSETGSTPPSGVDQANMFQSKSQDTPSNQSLVVNHINQSPVGTTPQTSFYPSSNGTQQTFNGTNRPSNGPLVCDYNHGYNNSEQPIQKHYHTQDQRKKSKKFKRKHYNSYQDSGGGHYH